ncbi:MAG: zf-HC2 domain-containing protein [Planctomycetes bacterium]|nr:zf-HC2 domain-containing protein [Planctomycetota bacterium]
MPVMLECRSVADLIPPYLEGALSRDEISGVQGHLRECEHCRQRVQRFQQVQHLAQSVIGPSVLSPDFHITTGKRIEAVTASANPIAIEFDDLEPAPQGFMTTVSRGLSVAPWWAISGAFHALLLLLLTLIGMAVYKTQDQTVIVTDLARQNEPEDRIEPVKRDIFKKPVTMDATMEVTEQVLVQHEEVEIADHVETDQQMDMNTAQGEENAIADVPLGGSGAFAGLGLGGGGGGAFGHRVGGGRRRAALKNGGSLKTESAVDAGLAYLARVQEADGHWDVKKHEATDAKHGGFEEADVAVTGLALLAFLGAGHTEKVGKYKDNVKRAVDWLVSIQKENGALGPTGYAHAIAGMALSEAAGMGRIERTKEAAQKAVDLDNGKGTKFADVSERGGWGYGYTQMGDVRGDLSNSGWHIMFLKSAKVAGLKVDQACLDGVHRYLDAVERGKKEGDPYSGHLYVYSNGMGDEGISPRRTAMGCLGRLFFGSKPEDLENGIQYIMDTNKPGYGLPKREKWNNHVEMYYVYYGTLVIFQAGGERWKLWNEALQEALLPHQVKDGGPKDGSWDPNAGYAKLWGRVGETAFSVLCLEVFYRYLPMYR